MSNQFETHNKSNSSTPNKANCSFWNSAAPSPVTLAMATKGVQELLGNNVISLSQVRQLFATDKLLEANRALCDSTVAAAIVNKALPLNDALGLSEPQRANLITDLQANNTAVVYCHSKG